MIVIGKAIGNICLFLEKGRITMRQAIKTNKAISSVKKTASPKSKGDAVLFYSTRNNSLPEKKYRSNISLQCSAIRGEKHFFLSQNHYFRRSLAEHPITIVLSIRGQFDSLDTLSEVTA